VSWLSALFGTKAEPEEVDFAAGPLPGLLIDDLPAVTDGGLPHLLDDDVAAAPVRASKDDESTVASALDALVDESMVDYLKLTPTPLEAKPWSSKVGGRPYVLGGCRSPRGKGVFAGQRLHLLAQLNFDELPTLPGMPTTGLLQFFVAADERFSHVYGADPVRPTSDDGFRVVYHPRIVKDASLLTAVAPDPSADPFLPVVGECLLTGQIASHPMSSTDHRFESWLSTLVCSTLEVEEIPEWAWSAAVRRCGTPRGHQIGGYPGLTTNLDPREQFSEHTTLLFQLASDTVDDTEVAWGDGGVGAFFIAPDRLAALDFSDVLYVWG